MNSTQKTLLFYMISIGLLVEGFSSYRYTPQWIFAILYIAYIVFVFWVIKGVKLRFLAYPTLVLSLFMGFYFYESSGMSEANATGLGYLLIFGFIFVILPIMLIALAIGAVFDINEITKKRKKKGENQ